MNGILISTARNYLLETVPTLPEGHQKVFRLLYGRNNGKRSVDDAKSMTIEDVVVEIPEEKLSWAMTQVENSIKKLEARNEH